MTINSKAAFFKTVFGVLFVLTFFSCSNGKKWYTNFDEASAKAKKSGKNIFLLFSGDDWDNTSAGFKADVLQTDEFAKEIGKKYVLLNLDFSQDEYAKTEVEENATEEEKTAAQEIATRYQEKEKLVLEYHVQQYPAVFITTPEGYYIDSINYDASFTDFPKFYEKFKDHQGLIDKANGFMQAIKKAKGKDKVLAIDAFYESTPVDYQPLLVPMFKEVPSLDEENETGLLGKYELAQAYIQSFEIANEGNVDGAVSVITSVADNPALHLDKDQKQMAYYTGAYILSLSGSHDFNKVLDLLQKAYDASPNGIHAKDVQSAKGYTENLIRIMDEYSSEEGEGTDESEDENESESETDGQPTQEN
ncbi:MAG: thioredoxin family protein [Treponema sp.]|nr:thioredoxin family protein [Treponema sp.]